MGTMMVGGVHGMDTMGQLLKENYDPQKRILGFFGVKLLVRTSYSAQCSSFYLCHWQRYVTFNMWVTRVTTVVTIVQGFVCWSQLCQNIVGHNRARISWRQLCPQAKATTVRGSKGEKRVLQLMAGLPDGGGRLEDVEVLQDVWNGHQAQCS